MKLKFRVTTHNFVDDKQTQVQLQGFEKTNGNFNLTLPNTEAAKKPVGSVLEVTISDA